MPSFTLKNIPDQLFDRLRSASELNHRSISGEILARLERTLGPALQPSEVAERARDLRQAFRGKPVTLRDLTAAKGTGRP